MQNVSFLNEMVSISHPTMAPKAVPDPRTIVRAEVHARAASVLRPNENKQIHGTEAGSKLLDGVIRSIKEKNWLHHSQ